MNNISENESPKTEFQKADYATARQAAGFDWDVSGSQDALRELTGTPIREFNLNPKACIEAYRKGRPLHREFFGPDVGLPGLLTPAVSYGHINGLGAELIFPEDGEVAHTPLYGSLNEGIAALNKPVDFARAGMTPFFIDFWRQMQAAFPSESVGFYFKHEGPITTAWALRGEGFFTDIYDDPPAAKEFLRLTTASIIEFSRFQSDLLKRPAVNPSGAGLCDDIASMVHPDMWPEFVLPYWEQYFQGLTTGTRGAHVEDLRPAQLKYLEEIGLVTYDPSISPKLNPRIISAGCRVPFTWRLGSFHYRGLTLREVEDFVFQAAADGATGITTGTEANLCSDAAVSKIHAFIGAAKEAKRMVNSGASRTDVGQRVSPEGKVKFWSKWSGFKEPTHEDAKALQEAAWKAVQETNPDLKPWK